MLLEIFLGLNAAAFILTVLSFIPLGEKTRTTRSTEAEELKSETQSFVVLFPWLAMGILFFLSVNVMDITIVDCVNQLDFMQQGEHPITEYINETYTNSWTCNEYQYGDFSMPWFYAGLATIMLVYAIISTFLWSAGTLLQEVKRLPFGPGNKDK